MGNHHKATSAYILVIDVGSSSVRALLFNQNGQMHPDYLARRVHTFSVDATSDAVTLKSHVEACLDDLLARVPHLNITAVGIATFAGNLLGISDDNTPLTPLYTYADKHSTSHANQLAQTYDMQANHDRTGCRIHPAYHPAKLAWLRQLQPQTFEHVALWVDFATYCYRTWFAHDIPTSYSLASWTGMLNRDTLTWDSQWLDALALSEERLPQLADYHQTQQSLSPEYRTRWRSLADVPFYLAIGDGAAANVGATGDLQTIPTLTIGTTSALRIITPTLEKDLPLGLWSYRVDANRHLIGGAINEGGNIFAWAHNTLKLPEQALDEHLLALPPAQHGLTALPLFAGERSPYYQADASCTLTGITLQTTSLQILQALIEGVAFRLRLIFNMLPTSLSFIFAGGGTLHASSAWLQIMADVLEHPLHLLDDVESTARGVALLIGEHQGFSASPTQISKIVHPRPLIAEAYAQAFEKHQALYATLYP